MAEEPKISIGPPGNCTESDLNIALAIVGGTAETRENMMNSIELAIKEHVDDVIVAWDGYHKKFKISYLID